ncbi:hypothetical protein RSSM_03438 [Rhodopirellula sallentina SM41]|uniref:Uncharacterized protein n=2 Tax=Rhodopirellula TaxID=265488 RepID=M5U1F6_9BACT|nr:hypothetical protein RSSM_03438 [Rhodopirellula sallentina SM41]
MATRSFIARKITVGYEGCYCHWDGYLEGVGQTLVEYYLDEDKIAYLLSFGDISSLGTDVGSKHDFMDRSEDATTFYGRDRGETGTNIQTKQFPTIERLLQYAEYSGCEFVYLFERNGWRYASRGAQYFGLSDGSGFSEFQWMKSAATAA